MVDNSQENRLEYWATRSSVRSFARTAHSFACGTVNDWIAFYSVFFSILAHSGGFFLNATAPLNLSRKRKQHFLHFYISL